MKFSIRDLLLVTVIVALALGWFLDHQKHAKLTEKLTKLAEENKKLQIQADLVAIDRAVQSREFEQYKLKTLVNRSNQEHPLQIRLRRDPYEVQPAEPDDCRGPAAAAACRRILASRKPT